MQGQRGTVRPCVVAVVVAYNRRALLVQCLDALLAQSRPVDAVVVVDNASHDGSDEAARTHALGPDVLRLPRNTGGAGGFAVGLAHALQTHEADLVWLMDDDTVATATALAELLAVREAYPGRPALLASRVVWRDGRDHPLNTPRRRPGVSRTLAARAAGVGAVQIRTASFVSVLVDGPIVREVGLPRAAYFLWNDDFEFTARCLRRRVGLFVPASVVRHLTAEFGTVDTDPGDRFSLEVRNKVWTFARSPGLRPWEVVLYGGATLARWGRTVRRSRRRRSLLAAGRHGLGAALAHRPPATADVLADIGAAAAEVAEVESEVGRRG